MASAHKDLAGKGELVLVTGATGYIAANVVKDLLDIGGYRVRATVRSVTNNKKLENLKEALKGCKTQPEFVSADLLNPSSWKGAVEGCDYVIHMASPFVMGEPADPEEVIGPARDGTMNVIKACAEVGGVKRVVLTSSCVAVYSGREIQEKPLTESDWSDVEKSQTTYDKSKAIAEKVAWDFVKTLPAEKKFELAVINPGFVVGPMLTPNSCTSGDVITMLMKNVMPMLPPTSLPAVDVRDVSLAHIKAMKLKEAAGHRHITSARELFMRNMAEFLAEEFNGKGYDVSTKAAPDPEKYHKFDNTRMRTVLGIQPRNVKDAIVAMAHTMRAMGLL